MSRIALDWDGTLVENKWPKMGDWMPGAREGVRELLDAGHSAFIYSARLSPFRPDGTYEEPGFFIQQLDLVREMLNDAGLAEVDIWQGEGKPFWDVLIDDKCMWFPGRNGSWRMLVPKILVRLKDEDGFVAAMEARDA